VFRLTALALAVVALLASPAAAKKDDGPYSPFPEGDPVQRALEFVHRLNAERLPPAARREAARIGVRHLIKGTSVADPGTTPPEEKVMPREASSPSRRAGVNAGADGPGEAALPFALVAVVLAAAAIGFEIRARRRPLRA
jgi:hypothetical protein